MARSIEYKAKIAKMKSLPGGDVGYNRAAAKYVNDGINKLGIKPQAKDALRARLIPIVARQMGAERGRAALRGEAKVTKTAKDNKKNTEKKFRML